MPAGSRHRSSHEAREVEIHILDEGREMHVIGAVGKDESLAQCVLMGLG